MNTVGAGRFRFHGRGKQWLGLGTLSFALAAGVSCQDIPGPVAERVRPFDIHSTVQEGEVLVWEGDEVLVRYPKAFKTAPSLTLVEIRQSWCRDVEKPYSKGDFVLLQQEATGFKVVNNHPGPGRASEATIKWRAEGVLAAEQPAPPTPVGLAQLAQRGQATPEQLVEAIKAAGGTVSFDPAAPLPAWPVVGVDLHHTKVTDAELEQLRVLTRLRTLSLSGTKIGDGGLRAVGGLTTLQVLLLNETPVTDAGLAYLQRLADLRELSLYHTRVTDDGLGSLAGLANLRDLTLSGPHITDHGLARLTGLRNLRHLYLSQTGVSPAGVAELKKALPKVEVIQ